MESIYSFRISICRCECLVVGGFFFNFSFPKNVSRVLSKCQTVRTQIRPDKMSGLIGVQTVCKTTKVTTNTERAKFTFVVTNSMDPNQARRFVRPDLDPNCLTLLKDFFLKKSILIKDQLQKKMQNYPACYLVKD